MPRITAVSRPVLAQAVRRGGWFASAWSPAPVSPCASPADRPTTSYEMLVMVGRIISDRTREPANHEKPTLKPAQARFSRSQGTRMVMPSQPRTTLGMPTKTPSRLRNRLGPTWCDLRHEDRQANRQRRRDDRGNNGDRYRAGDERQQAELRRIAVGAHSVLVMMPRP